MTAVALAPRAARARAGAALVEPRRAPLARPVRRPNLRVIPARDDTSRRARRRRRTVVLAAVLTLAAVFTVVAFHVFLAQGQLAIDTLEQRTATAEREYDDARLEHARLSAPQRIVERAKELGLTLPAQPPTPIAVEGELPPAPDAPNGTMNGWTDVKPTLGEGP
jgi:cell division protein FtsL